MSQNKTAEPVSVPADIERQVNEAKQLVREAGRALKRLEEKTRVVLITSEDLPIERVSRDTDEVDH